MRRQVSRGNFPLFLQLMPDLELRIKAIADLRTKQYEMFKRYEAAREAERDSDGSDGSDEGEDEEGGEDGDEEEEEEEGDEEELSAELADMRRIFRSLDADDSGCIDEWELCCRTIRLALFPSSRRRRRARR